MQKDINSIKFQTDIDDNINDGMSLLNALFSKMRAEILLFSPLCIIMQSLYNNQALLFGVQWKLLCLIYCPNPSFLKEAGPFV